MSDHGNAPTPRGREELRGATLLLAAGALPFLVGRAISGAGVDLDEQRTICPFRLATGVPCPLCGATRAVVEASTGDAAFLDYGAVWALVLAAAAVTGAVWLALAVAGARPLETARRAAPRRPWARWVALGAVVACAWGWALAHRATIVPESASGSAPAGAHA